MPPYAYLGPHSNGTVSTAQQVRGPLLASRRNLSLCPLGPSRPLLLSHPRSTRPSASIYVLLHHVTHVTHPLALAPTKPPMGEPPIAPCPGGQQGWPRPARGEVAPSLGSSETESHAPLRYIRRRPASTTGARNQQSMMDVRSTSVLERCSRSANKPAAVRSGPAPGPWITIGRGE